MRRYGCFSVTGWDIVEEGQGRHPKGPRTYRRRFGQSASEPRTTWYVADNWDQGRIVFASELEHEAREFVFQSNAAERGWQKQREHLLADIEEHP